MALPPLYKYLDVRGAKLTLGNGTFKHAKPSDFNDIEDLTIQSIFPEETEEALKKLANGFTDVILQRLDDPPTCISPTKEMIELFQRVYRTNPKAAEIIKADLSNEEGGPIYDVDHMRERSKVYIKEINDFMQEYRVLCVTTRRDSEEMWSTYAEDHKGVMLRIEPNVAKNSIFQSFRPVEYREKRPPLHDNTLDFIAKSLFGDQLAWRQKILDKIIYTKTLRWQHEAEYRLAIPLRKGERPWNVLDYHPEEVTELYLGLAMTNEDKDEIIATAKDRNPNISIFQAERDGKQKLKFNPI